MKLKCDTHGRRVLSVSNSPYLLHRTGDKSRCSGQFAVMQDNISHITRKFVVTTSTNASQQFDLAQVSCDKKSRPHAKSDSIDLTRYTRSQE